MRFWTEHENYPRTDATRWVVNAAGYAVAAYFAERYEADRYARWLRSLGYGTWVHDIAVVDRARALSIR